MSLLKPLSSLIKQSDLDLNNQPLLLGSVVRSAYDSQRGRFPEGVSHFSNPTGILNYVGFGADGWYYTNGVQGRVWNKGESLDDFADLVTDAARWVAVGDDLSEGGLATATPFGKRLFASYTGPAQETYRRKGLMSFASTGSAKVGLSGRVTTRGDIAGIDAENSVIFGLQQIGSDADFVFVGFARTGTYNFHAIQGQVVAGVLSVTGSFALPALTQAVTLALILDENTSEYQGFYSLADNDEDYDGFSWSPIDVAVALPARYPSDLVPTAQISFPAGYTVSEEHRLSDLRVEEGAFDGQEKASWWLEGLDPSLPLDLASVSQEAPSDTACVFEKEGDAYHLTLLDVSTPSSPLLWRRWKNVPSPTLDPHAPFPFWSQTFLSMREGHIVLNLDTKTKNAESGKGELWLFSLRWDCVIVFHVAGLDTLVSSYAPLTGKILREKGSWGARRWVEQDTSQPLGNYEQRNKKDFVGTFQNKNTEDVAPAICHGVDLRRRPDGTVLLAYGVQDHPSSLPSVVRSFSSVLVLEENSTNYPRALFQKNSSDLWTATGEGWRQVALTSEDVLYWTETLESGPQDQLSGSLCRADLSVASYDNDTTLPNTEDESWGEGSFDLYAGQAFSLHVQETSMSGQEIAIACSGWLGESFSTVLWRNPVNPAVSSLKTFGNIPSLREYSYFFDAKNPSPFFPSWFVLRGEQDAAALQESFLSLSRAVGVDSLLPISSGFSVAWAKFLGITSSSRTQEVVNTIAIERNDFVLDLSMSLVPFFAPTGSVFNVCSSGQRWSMSLSVRGEKGLIGGVTLLYVGNQGGGGGVYVQGFLSYYGNAGVFESVNLYNPTLNLLQLGVSTRLRIKRTGSTWSFLFWDEGLGSFVEVLSCDGLQVPLIGGVVQRYTDSAGGVGSCVAEIESFELAPVDDPQGSVFSRPKTCVLERKDGHIVAGAGVRELISTSTSGNIVLSEGWSLPAKYPF